MGAGTAAVLEVLDRVADALDPGASPADLHAATRRALSGGILDAARSAAQAMAWN